VSAGPARLRVRHVTDYRYDAPVTASYNELRVTPRTGPAQVVLEARLDVTPVGRVLDYVDYFGTVVHVLDLHVPHRSLVIVGTAVVETGWPVDVPSRALPLRWDDLGTSAFTSRFVEYLQPTAYTAPGPALDRVAVGLRGDCQPAEAPELVSQWARTALSYAPGTTGVHTSAQEAFGAGSGVCQDFAHLAITVLRTMGIPVRYVSGYLHPKAEAAIGESVSGESHAWIEAWDGATWVAVDPTNGRPVGRDHVLVATGRDYADVSPVKGVYAGGGSSSLTAAVEITRLA
jgi:transglutaminase-like putative cysteine protease